MSKSSNKKRKIKMYEQIVNDMQASLRRSLMWLLRLNEQKIEEKEERTRLEVTQDTERKDKILKQKKTRGIST